MPLSVLGRFRPATVLIFVLALLLLFLVVVRGAQDGAQEELLEVFKSDTFADTVRQVGQGRCSDASANVLLLWEFVGLKVYPRLSKDYRNFVEKGNVSGGGAGNPVTTLLHPSDEALCLTILEVKMEEFLLWIELGNKRKRGQDDPEEFEGDDSESASASTVPPHTRRRKQRRGRISRRELTQDGKPRDLTLRRSDYNAHMRRMKKVRSDMEAKDRDGPTIGWYEHLAGKILESREQEETAGAEGGNPSSSNGCDVTHLGCDAEDEVLIDTEGLFAAFGRDRIVEI